MPEERLSSKYFCRLKLAYCVRVGVKGRGLNCAREWALLVKNKTKRQQKPPCRGKHTGKAWQDRTRQDKARQGRIHPGLNNDELVQDYKHKEIIKVANEEGNEERQVGQINQ